MDAQSDAQLLRAYAERRSDAAFAELVRRHIDLVHSAARRMVGDAHLADDVTQATFLALAKNAAPLTERAVLAGWLHRTAQNIAAQTVRTDVRRRAREQEAAAMNELLADNSSGAGVPPAWSEIAPHLDAALGELTEPERDAVLLRYFNRQSAREMAQTLGISDDAAQKRVSRAVDRLREHFAKRGVTVGASGLAVVISANAVQAAPVGLALTITTATTLAGATLATTATITATKAIAMTALQKTIVAATVAALAGVGIYEARQASELRAQVQTLQQQQAPLAEQIKQVTSERDNVANQLALLQTKLERWEGNSNELLRLRAQVNSLLRRNQELDEFASAQTNETTTVSINEAEYVIPDSWEHAGQDSATAAIRTALWAMAHGDTVKLMNVLSLPPEVKNELARKSPQNTTKSLKGARISEAKYIGLEKDECVFMVQLMDESELMDADSGKFLGIAKSIGEAKPYVVKRFQDVWRVIPTGGVVFSPEEIAQQHAEALAREKSETSK
jgi:RNA polymerase sigma factor (sigma-70 family)